MPVTSRAERAQTFASVRLEQVFDACIGQAYRTRLAGGACEPLYQPAASPAGVSVIYYRNDFFASALHEVAHWCLAGAARRNKVDYGYWYTADGRDAATQRAFEAVEYRPQALEWIFSRACGWQFCLSIDNLDALDGQLPDTRAFGQRVLGQVRLWQAQGLPSRAATVFNALWNEFAHERAAACTGPAQVQCATDVAPVCATFPSLVFSLDELS
ncbi:MAG: elongation factor P hydroxylase [Gammaproteobacteria bacterium]|nr:elongation factor P hydroxylase [Gammaproteobacteria bacterium]